MGTVVIAVFGKVCKNWLVNQTLREKTEEAEPTKDNTESNYFFARQTN